MTPEVQEGSHHQNNKRLLPGQPACEGRNLPKPLLPSVAKPTSLRSPLPAPNPLLHSHLLQPARGPSRGWPTWPCPCPC